MTMPHLENCQHSEDGWCLECVAKYQACADDCIDNHRQRATRWIATAKRFREQVAFWQGKFHMLRHENNKLRAKIREMEKSSGIS